MTDEAQARYNCNDISLYDGLYEAWKKEYDRRPQILRAPFVLWGRYNFDLSPNKKVKVVPSLSEKPATIITCQEAKLQAKFRRGWRILDYWIPTPDEVPPLNKDDTLHGWRYQYEVDRDEFKAIRGRLAAIKALGLGQKAELEASRENVTLKQKVEELKAQIAATSVQQNNKAK
jgi:hypothetical protein